MSAPWALLNSSRVIWTDSKEVAAYTGPEDASPWVDAGNILEEQKAELPADCYAAPSPVPESNNNKQPHSNLLLAGPLTKSQMQDNLYGHWLERAQKRLVERANPNARHGSLSEAQKQEILSFYTAGNTPS